MGEWTTELSEEEVRRGIEEAQRSPERAKQWIRDFLSRLAPEDLERAARENYNPIKDLVERFHLANPAVRMGAVILLKSNWKELEEYLTNVTKLMELFLQNRPELRVVLEKPEVRRYLNTVCAYCYFWLADYVDPPNVDVECPKCHEVVPLDPVAVPVIYELREERGAISLVARRLMCPKCRGWMRVEAED
jgi:Zn finger protein HypA/HybF involved in hydrogenase expression